MAAIALGAQAAVSQTGGGHTVHVPLVGRGGAPTTAPSPAITVAPTASQRTVTPMPMITPSPTLTITKTPGGTVTPVRTPTPATPPAAATWIFCANQWSGCSFIGRRTVRFGANGVYVYGEFFGALERCSADNFGGQEPNVTSAKCEYTSTYQTTTLAPPPADNHSMHHVAIDLSKIPLGSSGWSTARVTTTDDFGAPSTDDSGAFRTMCAFTHMAFDDPVIYPGQPGRSHLHAFFGNVNANALSTADSIANSGNSSCAGGILNRSAYWVPALIDTRTGVPVVPQRGLWYYKNGSGGIKSSEIMTLPKGLRMIAGNMNALTPAEAMHQHWGCESVSAQPTIPTTCPASEQIHLSVSFPQCWDGINLDSSDHRSHVVYPVSGKCPATHPVAIPEISLNVYYDQTDVNAAKFWRLSSDMYDASIPGGYSLHADWFDGWDVATKNAFVKNCSGGQKDCHGFLLGDGRTLY